MNAKPEELEAVIEAGEKVVAFLQSPVGVYLVGRAEGDEQDAKDKLAKCDPTDVMEIRKLQNQAMIPKLVKDWLAEVINQGQIAANELDLPEE